MGSRLSADLALFAEANDAIGTGHVIETLHVAEAAQRSGVRPVVIVPAEVPASILQGAPCPVERIESVRPDDLRACARYIRTSGVRLALTDFRCVTDAQLSALSGAGLTTYCIDELGGRRLTCHAVFNPTILDQRHRYDDGGAGPRVFAGPAYFPLAPEYAERHLHQRSFAGAVRSVVVSMGGVDRSGATRRIFDVLDAWPSSAERHLVLGGAFAWKQDIDRRLATALASWRVHRDVSSLADLFATADVVVTAGGNTLYELACVGTPAIVAHEDPHEAEQGQAFQERGFGFWVGRGADVDGSALLAALGRLQDPNLRRAHSAVARSIVDGCGATRICAIVQQDVERDSAVQA